LGTVLAADWQNVATGQFNQGYADLADGKEALALLLPMIFAYLRHASQTPEARKEDPVVLSCKDRLLAYMMSKRKPAGAHC
jgi:hypothetical protein